MSAGRVGKGWVDQGGPGGVDTDGWGTGVVRVDSLVPPGSWRRERGEEQSSSRTRQFGHTPCWASVDTANSLPCCSPPSVAVHYTDNSGRCPATHSPCAMLSTRAFHSMLTPLTRSAYRYSHQVAPQIHKKESKEHVASHRLTHQDRPSFPTHRRRTRTAFPLQHHNRHHQIPLHRCPHL